MNRNALTSLTLTRLYFSRRCRSLQSLWTEWWEGVSVASHRL